jgi:hypothetical protein
VKKVVADSQKGALPGNPQAFSLDTLWTGDSVHKNTILILPFAEVHEESQNDCNAELHREKPNGTTDLKAMDTHRGANQQQ